MSDDQRLDGTPGGEGDEDEGSGRHPAEWRDARVVHGRAMWLDDDDPRLSLSGTQFVGLLVLGRYPSMSREAIDAAAVASRVSPNRVRRWLATLVFRRALQREREEPVSFGFRLRADGDAPKALNQEQRETSAFGSSGAHELTEGIRRRAMSDQHPDGLHGSKPSRQGFKPLTPRELQAAALLATGMAKGKVAAALGVSRVTVFRYEQKPGFTQAMEAARVAQFERRADRAWALVDRSMDVIEESLDEHDPQTAMGYFKTMAPGLRDVRRVGPEPASSTALSLPAGETTLLPVVSEATLDDTEDTSCETCGRRMNSMRGLSRHVRLKHPSDGEDQSAEGT